MDTIHVDLDLKINASPEQVFAALTTGIALWWGAPYLENKKASNLILEPKIGGRFYETWGRKEDDHEGALHGVVIAIQRPYLLKMKGPFGMSDRAAIGSVSFELKRLEQGTQLVFSFRAIGEFDQDLKDRYCDGWKTLLNNMKSLLEKHHVSGMRHDPALEE